MSRLCLEDEAVGSIPTGEENSAAGAERAHDLLRQPHGGAEPPFAAAETAIEGAGGAIAAMHAPEDLLGAAAHAFARNGGHQRAGDAEPPRLGLHIEVGEVEDAGGVVDLVAAMMQRVSGRPAVDR